MGFPKSLVLDELQYEKVPEQENSPSNLKVPLSVCSFQNPSDRIISSEKRFRRLSFFVVLDACPLLVSLQIDERRIKTCRVINNHHVKVICTINDNVLMFLKTCIFNHLDPTVDAHWLLFQNKFFDCHFCVLVCLCVFDYRPVSRQLDHSLTLFFVLTSLTVSPLFTFSR